MGPKTLPWGTLLMNHVQSDNAEVTLIVDVGSTVNLLPKVITDH